ETDAAAALLRAELTGATVEMAAVVFVATVEAAVVPTLVPSAVVVVAIVVAASAGPDTTLGALDAAPDDVSAAAFVASAPTALVVGAAWPQAASASTATVAAPIRNHVRREYCSWDITCSSTGVSHRPQLLAQSRCHATSCRAIRRRPTWPVHHCTVRPILTDPNENWSGGK